ncbi:uncharacterized protein PV06_04681 [Exophiala oligosperma]|nr:uncharacterized protein PV06_04681 [Exophiala oligosperma]KIW43594.1 hypothetical protein PV06_04681 [Exophiala oligosperma]
MGVEETSPSAVDANTDGLHEEPRATQGSRRDSGKGAEFSSEPEKLERPTGFKLYLILASMTFTQFVIMLDISVIVTAIPQITDHFHSLLDVGWYGSAYQLASASLQPLSGKIYTYFNLKWAFLSFFFVFELGSLLCAVATSSTMLIVARAISGLGASGLLNGGLAIFAACLPKERQPAMFGVLMAIGQLGQACGPLIGGALTQYATWRLCFYINLPIGAVVAGILLFIRIPRGSMKSDEQTLRKMLTQTLDLVGFAIFAPASIQFFLALQYGGGQHAWDSATVIGLFCGSAAMFAIFLIWEYYKGDDAMIPLPILRRRTVWSACLTLFFIVGILICAGYYLPIWFQAVKGTTPTMSGVYILPNVLAQIAMSMVTGLSVPILGYFLPFILVGTSLAAIGYGLLSMLTPTYPTGPRVGYQIIGGVGCGAAAPVVYVALQALTPAADSPIAMAILLFSQNFGAAVFLTIAQTVFSNSLKTKIPQYAPGANVDAVLAAGATEFAKVVTPDQVAGVVKAFSVSVDHVFYLVCGAAGGAFICSWAMGWRDIRQKSDREPELESD